jgi:hypothetical protein
MLLGALCAALRHRQKHGYHRLATAVPVLEETNPLAQHQSMRPNLRILEPCINPPPKGFRVPATRARDRRRRPAFNSW